MGCSLIMSSKKVNMETKNKSSQSRKNRRRSTRNANVTNGETDDPKERCGKRPRDINAKENTDNTEEGPDSDVYKEIIDLLPSSDLNCSPAEVPAPPGTRVNLHGVILHETQGGLIVLNVRWRNKVYSGALIDAEKNKWATDRINDGPPAAEDNKQFQAPPPIKKLRIPTNSANNTPAEDSDSGSNKKKGAISPTTTTPTKTTPKTPRGNGKKRATQESPPAPAEETTPAKKSKGKILYNGEHLYECLEPNCEKKYKNKNGLSYHLRTMHPTKMESADESGKENKSDNSRDESDSGDDNFVIDEKADEESKDGDSEDKNANAEEQNGSQSDGEGDEEKREELTENEKQIDRLKLEAEKVQAVLSNMKQKAVVDDVKQEEMECGTDEPVAEDNSKNKNDSIKKEEPYDEEPVDKNNEENEGETNEPLVDVESDSLPGYQWKNENKDGQPPVTSVPSTKDTQGVIPTIKVDPSPSEENTGGEESGDHPKGTSRTIIHEDHVNSLNELFAPTQTYHQYSPTLTNLNPQKINESLTDALSKQPAVSTMSTVSVSQPKIESTTSEPIKETLAAKPSVEISRTETSSVPVTTLESRLPLDLLKGSEYIRAPMDYVACSDDERSISPENALTGCHKTYPQDERDVKTSKPNLLSISSSMYLNPLLQSMIEQSILGQPHSLIGQTQRTFEKSLLFKELGNKVSNAAMGMNTFQNKIPSSMPNIPNKMTLQDLPLQSNIDQKSLSSSMINPSSTVSDSSKTSLPYDPSREFPKPSLLEQRLLAHTQTTKSTESSGTVSTSIGNSVYLPHNSSFDQGPPTREHPLKQPSLLEQRLLADTVKSDAMATSNVSSNNKMFLQQPGSNSGPPIPRPGSKPEEGNKTNEGNEKPPTSSSFTVNRDPSSTEKPKTPATSLRINPPTSLEERVQIGTHTWFPEVVNDSNPSLSTPDYYNSPPVVSSSFRIPVPKTYPSYSIQSSINTSSISDPKNPKNVAKRAMQPVPIAPAPTPTMQPSRNEFSAPPLDYVSPNGDKEQSQMGRFTLTSDNRLIPSPAENRGRPRKVRVEKTKQIPIGTAQDIAKVRGPAETSLPRKPSSSSPVVRTSVIQGSIHPGLEGSPKPSDRGPDGHMMFPQHRDMRNYDMPPDERDRFNAHEKDLKPPMDMRNNDKYQGIGSPPGMYFSPTVGRTLLSPPLPRSASHSPRSVDMLTRPVDVLTRPGAPMPRSSPVGHHDGFSKAQFQMALERMSENYPGGNPPGGPEHARNVLEHARRKPELLRPSESPHDNRKHPLSPLTETLHVMQAYARAHELEKLERDRSMAEYLNSGRYPPPGVRNDFAQGRGESNRSMFEHRSPVEESEQARIIRERYMQQNRPNVYRGSPPSHSAPQPGHHSANLVLGTADGSIIGPLSSYENRPSEHKR